ncbi:MAG: glycosyltransferase [Lachnospiraceae bacterium]|nr:glycosyltransferase [Lachnospiraceae bacterium]
MTPLVSIIIPVYKVKDFLAECLESILAQDYSAFEIILIDDGNTDGSEAICDEYAVRDERITVVHKENEGQGIARNIGMDMAKGKYLMFVDSDDKLDGTGSISALVNEAERSGADITVGAFRRFDGESETGVNRSHLEKLSVNSRKFRFRAFYQYGHLAYVWAKLYRKAFMDKYALREPAYRFTQDKVHNLYCFARNPKYAFVDKSVYMYRVNPGSVTFKYKADMIKVWTDIARDIDKYFKECERGAQLFDIVSMHVFFGAFFLIKQESQHNPGKTAEYVRALKEYLKSDIVKAAMRKLAFGGITVGIGSVSWALFIRFSAILCCLGCYRAFCMIILYLREANIDSKITKRRYVQER